MHVGGPAGPPSDVPSVHLSDGVRMCLQERGVLWAAVSVWKQMSICRGLNGLGDMPTLEYHAQAHGCLSKW